MQLKFCGGARTVTGSQHLLSVNGHRILLECGLFQGRRAEAYEKNQQFAYDPAALDAVLLSHAHIDHSGNLPSLVARGYRGPIYATSATVALCQLMLRDSAYLQERDIEWVNKIRRRRGEPLAEPLYSIEDAEEALRSFVGAQYDRSLQVAPGVQATFRDAGHILGSAGILLELTTSKGKLRLGFSGDIGRPGMPVLRDPQPLQDLDVLLMESTYGDRLHSPAGDVAEALALAIRQTAAAGGRIVIPAFAVGRTQALVYELHKLFDQDRIPDIPIFVDSPLATNATEVFRLHPECFDRQTYRLFLQDGRDPFGFDRLRYVRTVEESKKLNSLKYPHIIISASGMAEGGRILHHLKNNLDDHRNLVLLVGYAARDTLARRLMDGEKVVRIFGEEYPVRCKVKVMDAFSAHADRRELLDYLAFNPPGRLQRIFLVHGEPDQALPFKDALRSQGYPEVHVPEPGEVFSL
ncbi:MAG: MBL fold metallo-hydrolase [Candidatus Latescibacteria bacterium]|nr:MBL fold metallo-hydrolase [Candidatus Latescibacterota bacterium]